MKLPTCSYAGIIVALGFSLSPLPGAFAEQGMSEIEEVIVPARLLEETLQDVPVTVAAFTEADLDRYNITNLVDASKMVPNMEIAPGGSGNGANMRLRGVGSSSISAAFDHSVAINLDGVVVNRGRFIHNSYLDMGQLEILKGPQSLYFGKSATAGVVSITTNDPGEEFEIQASGGTEVENQGYFGEFIVSGPLTDTLGARFAIGFTENDELIENYQAKNDPENVAISGADEWYGDDSLNSRLTLLWTPRDDFEAKLKYSYSEYNNTGGGTAWQEELCPEGVQQPTAVPAATLPFNIFRGVDDCKINGNTSKVNLHPALRAGLPQGYDDGQPGLEQDTHFLSVNLTWDLADSYVLRSTTGWVDLLHWELDDYSYGASVFGGLHNNIYKSLSQEFSLASTLDGPVNFQAGFFYQDIEQEFDAYQYAFNLPVTPTATLDILNLVAELPPGLLRAGWAAAGGDPSAPLIGPDPSTGNGYDYNKHHFLDTEVYSAFLAVYWDINDRTELTAGARYTKEDKVGRIEIPYLHAGARFFNFGAPPIIEDGLEFDDENVSPELAVNYHLNDDISVYVAYKEGFKSGGIDNSALPTAALQPTNANFPDFLIYDSEEAAGFEAGLRGRFLDGALRFNASAFAYEYSDLQVQLFNSSAIQFFTFNASALETEGLEFDFLWSTDIEGLVVRGAWAFTDAAYTEDFFNATDQNLKGEDAPGNADVTGYVGATYDIPVTGGWRVNLSADARYSGEYPYTQTLDPYMQDSFWVLDAAVSLYSEGGRHQFNLIGRNVTDEIYAITAGATPGRCANFSVGPRGASCNDTGANSLDQAVTTPLGRTLSLQYRFTM